MQNKIHIWSTVYALHKLSEAISHKVAYYILQTNKT